MRVRLRVWWQKIKQHPAVTIPVFVGSVLGIALVVLLVLGYWLNWHWTGLVPETSEPKQHAKTLWDWLNLLGVLAIPVVVALGAAWYTAQQGKVIERGITDNQRETALQGYIDKMSELLLHEKLRSSAEEDEVRKIARVRTLTILLRLDAQRKGSVLQFLHESGLVEKGKCIVNLHGADLRGADLHGADLSGVNLRRADLSGADLRGADLHGADLSGVNLRRADLSGVNLRRTDLSGGNLLEADLSLADLTDANITTEQLEKAKSLLDTIWPDGLTYPW